MVCYGGVAESAPERVAELVKTGSAQMGKLVKAAGTKPE
jgi:hypothetical protein